MHFQTDDLRIANLRPLIPPAILMEELPLSDEASAMERLGWRPTLVEGSPANIKVTHPDDLRIAGLLIKEER